LFENYRHGFTHAFDGMWIIILVFCVTFLRFLCLPSVTCVSGVASVSVLSILDCPFSFLDVYRRIKSAFVLYIIYLITTVYMYLSVFFVCFVL